MELTAEGRAIVEEVARRHGVSTEAASVLLRALAAGQGSQAQFNHPELGGMGQWSRGGMIMIGDMFNSGLKFRVDALCIELADLLARTPLFAVPAAAPGQYQGQGGVSLLVPGGAAQGRWPPELGSPASAGSQNDLHYAIFPSTRRLAIEQGGRVTVYDTGDHQIFGVGQSQSGDQTLSFTSQRGLVRLADLPVVSPAAAPRPAAAPEPTPEPVAPGIPAAEALAASPQPAPKPAVAEPAPAAAAPGGAEDDIFAKIEKLAELYRKQILSAEEFQAKKSELLSRL